MGSFGLWHWVTLLLILAIFVAPVYFYIRTYQSVSQMVNAKGGNAPVASAWCLFIPIFSIAWFFVLLIKLKDALAQTHIENQSKAWWNYGMIAGALYVGSLLLGGSENYVLWVVIIVAWLVFTVLHWVELSKLRKAIA